MIAIVAASALIDENSYADESVDGSTSRKRRSPTPEVSLFGRHNQRKPTTAAATANSIATVTPQRRAPPTAAPIGTHATT